MENVSNWILFSYNGNATVPRLIIGATFTQLSQFIDSGGNQDDPEEWLFDGWNWVQFVQIPNDIVGLNNLTNLVYCDGQTVQVWNLQRWIVDYNEYPEGKVVRLQQQQPEPEPKITGKNAL